MRKKKTFLAICFLLVLALGACGKEKATVEENSETVAEKEEPATETGETQKVTVEDQIPTDYAAAIIVTINPQVKMYVDVNNTIVGIEYLNEDAKTAYAGIDFLGKTVEEGMEQLVDAAVEKEFLTDGKEVSVDVAEVRDESYDCTKVCAKAEAAVTEAAKNCRIEAAISTTVSAPEATEQAEQTSSESQTEAQEKAQNKSEAVQAPAQEEPQVPANPCSNCGGTGKCDECLGDGYRGVGYTVSCPRCHGSLTETCIYCDAAGNSNKHEGTCDFPNCMGKHVYSCTTCGGGTTPVTCQSCGGSGKCKACGGGGTQ